MGRNELFGSGGVNHRKIMFQSARQAAGDAPCRLQLRPHVIQAKGPLPSLPYSPASAPMYTILNPDSVDQRLGILRARKDDIIQ